jgi:hypothetical protein
MRLVGGVDRAQDIELDAVIAQAAPSSHDEVEGALASSIAPIRIVQFARPVHAETDEKVVFLEEGAPVAVEQQPVG